LKERTKRNMKLSNMDQYMEAVDRVSWFLEKFIPQNPEKANQVKENLLKMKKEWPKEKEE
jgi:DNA-directed RNA polymerase subunit F